MVAGMVLKVIVASGLLNVWLLRKGQSTNYRGGDAKNLQEEFEAYGLPSAAFYVVGFLKVTSALLLLASFFLPVPVVYPAAVIAGLMVGALAMHIKVKDPLMKSLPAFCMLLMSGALVFLYQ